MTTETWTRLILTLILTIFLVVEIYTRQKQETRPPGVINERRRYLPYGYTLILPWYIFALFLLSCWDSGLKQATQFLLTMMVNAFLHICLYYLMLLLFLPFLRRHISARVCAALWMLPNGLYFTYYNSITPPEPLLILPLPATALRYGWALWFMGFLAVMFHAVLSHFLFRHKLLRNAYDVTDPEILALWETEQKNAGYTQSAGYKKPPFRLMYSPETRTPLSIGFFTRTVRVLLPEQTYTPEGLTLILRHEIVHIGREDCETKFFLIFCTAICWFNPFMWIAKRYCSDDLELSCDETVLINTDTTSRHRYAELLLHTAADNRGFTTCLSSSAATLRYRLKNIMKPTPKQTGGLLAGILFFVLVMTCGYITFSYDESTGKEYIFQNQDYTLFTIKDLQRFENDSNRYPKYEEEEGLKAYLADLPLCRLTGFYRFPESEPIIYLSLLGPDGMINITLHDQVVTVRPRYEKTAEQTYYCPTAIDWNYFD